MNNITISETELSQLLEKAYEEGWYGSKDMGETVAQRMVKDIKQPEYTESGCTLATKKLLQEANNYLQEANNYFQEPSYVSTPADHGDINNYGWTVGVDPAFDVPVEAPISAELPNEHWEPQSDPGTVEIDAGTVEIDINSSSGQLQFNFDTDGHQNIGVH